MDRLIIWGPGELGGRVARLWVNSIGPAMGFTQTTRRHSNLQAAGIKPHLGSPATMLQPADTLLLALPGYATQQEAIQSLIDEAAPPPARVVMTSSTGYYGPAYGIIKEDTPPGLTKRAKKIAAVETLFWDWAGDTGIIVRLAGLYRPGRGPLPALARRGAPPLRPPDKTLALIHYDDAASAVFAALKHPQPAAIYLAVTPPCPTRETFYRLACQQLNLPGPIFDAPIGQPPATYDVTRLRRDLLPEPAYPDWRAALISPDM